MSIPGLTHRCWSADLLHQAMEQMASETYDWQCLLDVESSGLLACAENERPCMRQLGS